MSFLNISVRLVNNTRGTRPDTKTKLAAKYSGSISRMPPEDIARQPNPNLSCSSHFRKGTAKILYVLCSGCLVDHGSTYACPDYKL